MKPGTPLAGMFSGYTGSLSMVQAMAVLMGAVDRGLVPGIVPDLLASCVVVATECAEHDIANKLPAAGDMPVDELAMIKLYTMPMEPPETSIYHLTNKALRNNDRNRVKPFSGLIWLLMLALKKAPAYDSHLLFRGVRLDLSTIFSRTIIGGGKSMKVTWQGFSSTTSSVGVLSDGLFLDVIGARTIFNIELTTSRARDISALSMITSESEVILPPNSKFNAVSVLGPSADGLLTVQLKEVPPTDPILNF